MFITIPNETEVMELLFTACVFVVGRAVQHVLSVCLSMYSRDEIWNRATC